MRTIGLIVIGGCSGNVSLFHGDGDEEEVFDMAQMTMGCGRRADSLKMALGWIYYGKKGYEGNLNPHLSFPSLFPTHDSCHILHQSSLHKHTIHMQKE